MLSFRSRGTSRLKKAGPRADDANDSVRSSIDNASTIGSVGTRVRRSLSLKERFGFRSSPNIKGLEGGNGSASGMGRADCGGSRNDDGGPASRELLVKRLEDCQGNNNAAIKSAGVCGSTMLKHSWEDNIDKTATVKHPEDGDNFEDGNDKNKCDRVDKRQGSGSDSGRVAADPNGTGREASAGNMTTTIGPSTNQLMGTSIDFNTAPHPPQKITNSPCQRFPPRPLRPPGPGQPANAQIRRLPLRAPTPAAGPAFRAPATGGTYLPSNLRTYSAASSASSSATVTPAMYSRRNFPVENRQMQYPPRRLHHPRQQPPPQQSAYYQPPQRPGPIRSGDGFPHSNSSSSSAKTGDSSSSPTTQSLESTESPPPLEPKVPSTKSSSEEFVTPSQTPNLEQARGSPVPYYPRNHGPPNPQISVEYPQHPAYPYPLQQRTISRPLKSAPFFHEGLHFAQISYNTTPEEVMAGPKLSRVQYSPFHLIHLDCMTQHKVMHKVHNLHHKVPCMTCKTMGRRGTAGTMDKSDDPAEYRFVCGWCAIRICAGCRDELRLQDNRLTALLRVIQEGEGRNGLGDSNATSELNTEMQPKASNIENTQLPVDLPASTPAADAEGVSNLSHFGPPGFLGGSTSISRLGADSSESETGGAQRRLTEFEEYDGEPCWPPPARARKCLTLDKRAELTNIEEYPRQRINSPPPIEPFGVNPQKRPPQPLPDPSQWNHRGPTPQPRPPFIPQRRSPSADSPELGQESERESEVPVESTDGRQAHQQAQSPHQEPPPRQSSPLLQVPPPQEPLPPRQPSPPQREATPRSTLRAIGRQEVPPKSPGPKESPPISASAISAVDSGIVKGDEQEVAQSKVMQTDPEAKPTGVKKQEVRWAQVGELETKLPGTKQQPTQKLDRPQVEEKQERRAKYPLPSPGPQRESTPRPDKPSRSTPSPRPRPTQATKMDKKREEVSPAGRSTPQPAKKLPEPEVVKPEPAPQPVPRRSEPVLATKQEKSVQPPIKQEKTLPEPPKLVNLIGDFTISKPATPPEERPVYPTKPEPNIDLSFYNLKPATTQERYKLPDSMQLPEIDFGGALDTMAMTDGILGRPARAYDKPPAAPIRLGGEEKEGSISGSMKDKKKWRLPGFGKKKVGKS